MNMFVAQDKAKEDTENTRGLNLAVVKLTTVLMTKLPLYQKTRKTSMICSGKACTNSELVYSAKGRIFSNMLYVPYVRLIKGQAYSQEINPSSRQKGCYTWTMTAKVQLLKKISGRESQGA
jgi:hypothetical protein